MQTTAKQIEHSAISSKAKVLLLDQGAPEGAVLMAAPFIDRACARSNGFLDTDQVIAGIRSGDMQLWLATDGGGAMVTQITVYPSGDKYATIISMSCDDFNQKVHLLEPVKKWAKHNKCKGIELYGRPGWEKRLKKQGFTKITTLLRLEENGW